MGGVTSVPAGYTISTVVVLSSGVNRAMDEWGDLLLKTYGKARYGSSVSPTTGSANGEAPLCTELRSSTGRPAAQDLWQGVVLRH